MAKKNLHKSNNMLLKSLTKQQVPDDDAFLCPPLRLFADDWHSSAAARNPSHSRSLSASVGGESLSLVGLFCTNLLVRLQANES
jgi:hypothetical protein